MRARHLLAALALTALMLAIVGCGGGGSGPSTVTANITGSVVDAFGNPINNATVTADVNGTPVSDTTDAAGRYTLPGVPVKTNLTLTVNAQGSTRRYVGIQAGTGTGGSQAPLDIVFSTETPPPAAGGVDPTISIQPSLTEVFAGTTPTFTVRVSLGGGVYLDGYHAIWTVSGAQGQISENGLSFEVSPGAVGSKITLRAMVRLADDSVITAERVMTVVQDDDLEPPPPPPI